MKNIAMRCTQEQFESIKSKVKYSTVTDFVPTPYLTNDWCRYGKVSNITKEYVIEHAVEFEVHETWNERIFLEACGIKVDDVFEITKEQIMQVVHNARHENNALIVDNLRAWFPSVFEVELTAVKWYVVKNLSNGCQGFNELGMYVENMPESKINGLYDPFSGFVFQQTDGELWRVKGDILEATPEEVKEALKSEWRRLGGENSSVYIESIKGICNIEYNRSSNYYYYAENSDILFYKGMPVFAKGVFAKLITTITKAEAEKQLNKKII